MACHRREAHAVVFHAKTNPVVRRQEDRFPSTTVMIVPRSESVMRVAGTSTVATGLLVVVPQKYAEARCSRVEAPYSLTYGKTDPVDGVVAPAITVEEVYPSQGAGCEGAEQGELVFEGVDE